MKDYIILFTLKGKKICTCHKKAEDEDQALLDAEFSLICKYPNVKYDNAVII